MSHARELLTSVLSTLPVEHTPDAPGSLLSATIVTKPNPITSVHAFNTQLTIGSKDEALRKAAGLFKTAAERMGRGHLKGEKYWVDALKIRWANWGLIPAPLPPGSATGKGADKTSKDFLISYGLEGCELTCDCLWFSSLLPRIIKRLPFFAVVLLLVSQATTTLMILLSPLIKTAV